MFDNGLLCPPMFAWLLHEQEQEQEQEQLRGDLGHPTSHIHLRLALKTKHKILTKALFSNEINYHFSNNFCPL